MRKILFTAVLVVCMTVFAGCGGRSMPEGVPEDFAIYYADWIDPDQPEIFDTYEGYIQKDLIRNGIAGTDYTPSDEVIVSIYDKIVELKLYDMAGNVRAEEALMSPMTYFEIRFTMNGETYEILADATIVRGYWLNGNIEADEAEKINEFCMFMQGLMMETEEYKSLPEKEGGYM